VALFKEGKLKEAKDLQLKLIEINFLVTGRFGIPGLKAALDMLGYQGGCPRRPLLPINNEGRAIVENSLKECGALK
jgi:4-hydroxy-2-oxoglutarate aldolase